MELTIQEKLKLIEFFEFQRDREVSKPIGEMDVDTIDAYVKILLDLQDKHHQLSSDFINEQVRKVFRTEENKTAAPETVKTTKKRYNKKMVWLIAACIALLVALFSIVSSATEWSFFDFLTEKFGSVHSTPIGEKIDFNGETIILAGSSATYSSVEEALEAEKIDILYPSVLPEGIEIKELLFHQNDSTKTMAYIFNDTALSLEVYFNTSIPEEEKQVSTEIREIDSITCYICDMPDISTTQITFEYNGNTYTFIHTEKDALIEIIENLKEIDYEN